MRAKVFDDEITLYPTKLTIRRLKGHCATIRIENEMKGPIVFLCKKEEDLQAIIEAMQNALGEWREEERAMANKPKPRTFMPLSLITTGSLAKVGASAFAVLLCIATATDSNGECCLSRAELAKLTGLSLRTIDRSTITLRRAGLLSWKQGGRGGASTYVLDLGTEKNK